MLLFLIYISFAMGNSTTQLIEIALLVESFEVHATKTVLLEVIENHKNAFLPQFNHLLLWKQKLTLTQHILNYIRLERKLKWSSPLPLPSCLHYYHTCPPLRHKTFKSTSHIYIIRMKLSEIGKKGNRLCSQPCNESSGQCSSYNMRRLFTMLDKVEL